MEYINNQDQGEKNGSNVTSENILKKLSTNIVERTAKQLPAYTYNML